MPGLKKKTGKTLQKRVKLTLFFCLFLSLSFVFAPLSTHAALNTANAPTVSLSLNKTSAQTDEEIAVTVSGTSSLGLASVWWFVVDKNNTSWHNIPGTVNGILCNLAAAHNFGAGYGTTSYTYTDTLTIKEPGEYYIKANSRDVRYPTRGEAHQASEGAGLARVLITVTEGGELIGPEGGEVSSVDGTVKIVIPAGALNETTRINVLPVNKETLEDATPSGTSLLSVVECKPYGLVFNKPVSIIYTLSQAEVPGTPVELGFYDAAQGKIISTGQTSTVPTDGYTVTFSVVHFSTYAALKSLTPQGTPIGGGVKIPLPDMFTGAFSHAIPITVPPGRKGIQPALGLTYRSSNPNSWVGLGFSLNPGYIVRSTRLGPPTYIDTQDTFYFVTDAGTTELVHLIDNLYQAKIESSFTKFFKETDDSWRVVGKDGGVLRFGQTTDSKEASTQGTFSWYLTKAIDTNGNYVEFNYTKDQGKSYLSRIDYTGNEIGISPTNSVEFLLEPRDDIASSYISSAKIATTKRLKEIQVKVNYDLVWRYVLEYNYSPDTNRSLLKSITQYGSDGKSLPTQSFSYQKAR